MKQLRLELRVLGRPLVLEHQPLRLAAELLLEQAGRGLALPLPLKHLLLRAVRLHHLDAQLAIARLLSGFGELDRELWPTLLHTVKPKIRARIVLQKEANAQAMG